MFLLKSATRHNRRYSTLQVFGSIHSFISKLIGASRKPTNSDQEALENHFEKLLNKKPYVNQEITFLRKSRDIFTNINAFRSRFSNDISVLTGVNTLSLHYLLERTEAIQTPSWKRRVHMYSRKVPPIKLVPLCKRLMYSFLTYEDITSEELEKILRRIENSKTLELAKVKQGRMRRHMDRMTDKVPLIEKAQGSKSKNREPLEWKVVCFDKMATSVKPAHFVATAHNKQKNMVELLIVLRGTYSVEDIVVNNDMEFKPLYDGMVHKGFEQAADFMLKEYTPLIQSIDLDNKSKSSLFNRPVKINLVGHSMGGAVASIMALKLRTEGYSDNVHVYTFGCPPTFSSNFIPESKKYITSTVCDDDVVPRLTDVAVKRLGNELLTLDWKHYLERDIDTFIENYWKVFPSQLVGQSNIPVFLKEIILKIFPDSKTTNMELINTDESTLGCVAQIPGKVIHLFRTGRGFAAAETDHKLFEDINFSRTMIDDHLLENYFTALLESK